MNMNTPKFHPLYSAAEAAQVLACVTNSETEGGYRNRSAPLLRLTDNCRLALSEPAEMVHCRKAGNEEGQLR